MFQSDFDLLIGRLDRVLSELVNCGRAAKGGYQGPASLIMDEPNKQTLKHHAEDMIAAGQKILKDLGAEVQGTPQPGEDQTTALGRSQGE